MRRKGAEMRELGDSNLSLGLVYARGEPNPIESAGEVKAAMRAIPRIARISGSASEFAVVGRLKAEGRCQTLGWAVRVSGCTAAR